MGLNTLSNNTTRRLDNTYYAVLQKLSMLQSTIMSMKELASMTKQLNEEFKTESEEVVHDVEVQLDGFEGFEEQQKRIEELQERVMTGRERVKTLGSRVDVVREKVEGWEKAEGEWQEKTRKRLRILWILMAICGMIMVAMMGMKYTPARNQTADALKGVNTSSLAEIMPDLERIKNETKSVGRSTLDALEKMLEKDEPEELEEDPRLRLFDEL
jgi:predicted RND superfamily exporter protein